MTRSARRSSVGFRQRFPDRLINVGIAEQNMVGVGAGLANGGMIPFVSAASCFLTGRALEQIKADIAYAGFNVKLVGQSSGIAYGELGPTHHSIEDFAWLRAARHADRLSCPADPWETAEAAVQLGGRPRWPGLFAAFAHAGARSGARRHGARSFVPGVARLMRRGGDVAIIATGTTVHLAIAAATQLAGEGIDARVLDMHTIAPLDDAAVEAAATECGALVTVEEALVRGGLGGAVAELASARCPVPVERVGFPGFQPTGSVAYLFEQFGLTGQGIAAAARRALKRKRG